MYLLFPSGGLGNQMFMIATVYSFAKSTNQTFYVDYTAHNLIQGQQLSTYLTNLFHQVPLYTPERKAIVEFRLHTNPPTLEKEIVVDYFQHTMFTSDLRQRNKVYVCLDSNFTSAGYFHNYRSQLLQLFSMPHEQYHLLNTIANQYLHNWAHSKSSQFQTYMQQYSLARNTLSPAQVDFKIAKVKQQLTQLQETCSKYSSIKVSYDTEYPTPESRILKRTLTLEELAEIQGTVDTHAPLPVDFPHFYFNHLTRQHLLDLQALASLEQELAQLRDNKVQPHPNHFPTDSPSQLLKQLRKHKEVINLSLHVRRGDYLHHQDIYRVLDADYYSKALQQFQDIPKHIVVFSDDLAWAQATLPSLVTDTCSTWAFVAEEIPDHQALLLMARCDHHILANSTFSWWGQYLNPNPNRIVIAPRCYYVNNQDEERVALLHLPQFILID